MAALRLTRALTIAAFSLLLFAGCDDSKKSTDPSDDNTGELMPDFSIQDVNPNSATHDQTISPRQYIGGISCWYFGHAT
jgi:hypothetical protein